MTPRWRFWRRRYGTRVWVIRYPGQDLTAPGSECLWWRGAVSGRGHGRFYVGTVVAGDPGESDRDLHVIAHRFGYGLIYGPAALNTVPVLGHGRNNRCASGSVPATSRRPRTPGTRRAYLVRRSLAGNHDSAGHIVRFHNRPGATGFKNLCD